jgi:hypothetical protein
MDVLLEDHRRVHSYNSRVQPSAQGATSSTSMRAFTAAPECHEMNSIYATKRSVLSASVSAVDSCHPCSSFDLPCFLCAGPARGLWALQTRSGFSKGGLSVLPARLVTRVIFWDTEFASGRLCAAGPAVCDEFLPNALGVPASF